MGTTRADEISNTIHQHIKQNNRKVKIVSTEKQRL